MKKMEYNIGLDIGVGSIGWCVTDENSNVLKRNSKNMWGARIFKEADTAANTRILRSARRIERRKERINILQSLLQDDMEKEFPNFFPMLRETSLTPEEKSKSKSILGVKYNLFSDEDMTDTMYYNDFKTIYHLRNYLMNTSEKADLRLVYLAIHHIIKYRGNFLYEGDFSDDTSEVTEKINEIIKFLEDNYQITLNSDKNEIVKILLQKNLSKADKKDKIIFLFDFEKSEKPIISNTVASFLGYKVNLNKIFGTDMSKDSVSFNTEIDDEESIREELGEYCNVYDAMKSIYSWFILQDILNGKTYISEALIEKYNKYSEDLKLLKKVYKEYFSDEYSDMFRKIKVNNYVAYNGKNSGEKCKKCKPEDFFDMLKKKIDSLPDNCIYKEKIKQQITDNNFLVKINVTDNAAIPYQLHKKELEKILDNQCKYYETLNENKDNILKLFEFRIPYYVGPLAKDRRYSKWSWVVRRTDEKVRPWNFNEIIDEDSTAEKFIRKMTNKCTYLINEDVMPKHSLLYSKFCVLNELNNVKVSYANGDSVHLGNDIKKKIIEKLFKTKKKVTESAFKEFMKHEGYMVTAVSGLVNNAFNSSMGSYIDMSRVLGKVDESNFDSCEEIIYWITIFEEKRILRRKIKQKYSYLTDEQIDSLCKLNYSGWSRLSKTLILGLKAYNGDSIMDKLENTKLNFMQIINEKKFGFNKKIEEMMPIREEKIKYKDIEDMPTSPANKRAIWQAICVVKEIVNVMKHDPKNIYIEFARGEENEKRMKDTRIKQLLKKYEDIEKQLKTLKDYDNKVYKQLKMHQSDRELSEKMYLYFLQNGKCLYSGKTIDIDNLSYYEVDHILPRSYVKDDSIDNKALVLKEENQRKKDSLLLADEIIDARMNWWKSLLDKGLITQSKFYKLIRRKMFETDAERERFVQRQLVETRQITKYVTNLLVNEYKNSKVFALRAELTGMFRNKYKIYKNRNVNNYHHAHDAYIISAIGNVIDKEWRGDGSEFRYSEYVKKYMKDERNAKEKNGMIIGYVSKFIDTNKVKKIMNYNDCFISRMLEEGTGEFYHQTLYSPKDKPSIPLKDDKLVTKYGGYSNEYKAYCVIYKYLSKKQKTEYRLIGIPIKVSYDINSGKESLENYIRNSCLKDIEYSEFEIIREKIFINQEYLDENGELMRLCSDAEFRAAKELVLNQKMQELVYFMNSDKKRLNDEEREVLEQGYLYMFGYLLDKLAKEYKVFEDLYLKLKDKLNVFMELGDKEKGETINGLISLMATGQGNLKTVGLTDREGRKAGKKFKTDRLLNMTFIDRSVTGMFEKRFRVSGV